MDRGHGRFAVRFGTVLALALAGVGTAAAQDTTSWWLPPQAATVAAPIDELFGLILWITLAVFALVFGLLAWIVVRYRHREGRRAAYTHGNTRLEIAWTVIPAVILVFLGLLSQSVWSDIKVEAPAADSSLVIRVSPRQFQWDVRYAGEDGRFETRDDITTTNLMGVPVGRTVLLEMRAQDVIHSFFVPEFRMKQDAVPGMTTRYWFTATKTGEFEIACAELCGLGHYRMKGSLTVMDAAEYDEWIGSRIAKKRKQLAERDARRARASRDTTTSRDTIVSR